MNSTRRFIIFATLAFLVVYSIMQTLHIRNLQQYDKEIKDSIANSQINFNRLQLNQCLSHRYENATCSCPIPPKYMRFPKGYQLGKRLGSGGAGDIYMGINLQTGDKVAIKLECKGTPDPQLHNEYKYYKMMQGTVGVPTLIYYGPVEAYNALIIELLGHSLEDLFEQCRRKFTVKTVVLLADQLITRLESIHNRGFIHRDIKPDNFLMGLGSRKMDIVYLTDFGLAKPYLDPLTHKHILYGDSADPFGTPPFASISTHLGKEESRRDDLESLAYMLILFVQGSLPWEGLDDARDIRTFEIVGEIKANMTAETLCFGLPSEFATYVRYVKDLLFDQQPDYNYMRKLFRNAARRFRIAYDDVFDWEGSGCKVQ